MRETQENQKEKLTRDPHRVFYRTCEGKEHPGGSEQVVTALPKREDDTDSSQGHEEQAEYGDGCC